MHKRGGKIASRPGRHVSIENKVLKIIRAFCNHADVRYSHSDIRYLIVSAEYNNQAVQKV